MEKPFIMKIILAICGKGSTGKSSAISHFFRNHSHLTNVTVHHPRRIKVSPQSDIVVSGTYITKKILGINSIGDGSTEINKYVGILINANCDIIVTACRPESTNTFRTLEGLAKNNGYTIITTSIYSQVVSPRCCRRVAMRNKLSSNIISGVDLNDFFAKHISDLIQNL